MAAVLALYPPETIQYVTDPRTGIPSRSKWVPTIAEVRDACEDHYGPTRRALEREAAERRQIEERKVLALPDNRPRPTYEQLVQSCAEKGLYIGQQGKASRLRADQIHEFREAHGISAEQWASIPDAK